MMQLNNTHRAAIISSLVKTTYKERFDALVASTFAFSMKAWEHEYEALEKTLRSKLTKEQLQRCFSGSPGFVVSLANPREGTDFLNREFLNLPFVEGPCLHNGKVYGNFTLAGEVSNQRHRGNRQRFTAKGKLATIEQQVRGDIDILPDHPLRSELEQLMRDQESLINEAESFIDDLSRVLTGITTDKKLEEMLPEAVPYLPVTNKSKSLVPTETIEAVRKRLNTK